MAYNDSGCKIDSFCVFLLLLLCDEGHNVSINTVNSETFVSFILRLLSFFLFFLIVTKFLNSQAPTHIMIVLRCFSGPS